MKRFPCLLFHRLEASTAGLLSLSIWDSCQALLPLPHFLLTTTHCEKLIAGGCGMKVSGSKYQPDTNRQWNKRSPQLPSTHHQLWITKSEWWWCAMEKAVGGWLFLFRSIWLLFPFAKWRERKRASRKGLWILSPLASKIPAFFGWIILHR